MILLRRSDPPVGPARTCRWLAAIASLMVTACKEGYSVDEPAVIAPQSMTQAQCLTAMNRLGSVASPERTWSYKLESACLLNVQRPGANGANQSLSVSLADVAVSSSYNKATKLFNVRVVQVGAGRLEEAVVLETPRWTDSVEFRSLIEGVQRGCGPTGTPPPEGR